MLTHIVLDTTIGQVVKRVECSTNPKAFLLYAMVRDAIMDLDVSAIEQIIRRVDGVAPDEGDREIYANLVGDALEDIMDYEDVRDVFRFNPDDPVIIVIAKALFIIAVRSCKNNTQMRKDKAKAMDIIFQRTGGRKTQPVREKLETKYTDAEWMAPLPSGEE